MEMLGVFVIGFLASLLGAISTGANLISVPGLIFLGIPPISAIATTRLSAITGASTVVYRYNKAKMVRWAYLPMFFGIAITAGILGPRLLLHINEHHIEPIIGALLLISLPLLFFKRSFGEKRTRTSHVRKLIGLVVLFVVMIYGTAFSIGGGVFLLYTLVYFFGMTLTEGNATGAAVWVLSAATASISYISNGDVDFGIVVPMIVGSVMGGYIGVRLAIKHGVHWVKYILAIVILVSAIKLLFF